LHPFTRIRRQKFGTGQLLFFWRPRATPDAAVVMILVEPKKDFLRFFQSGRESASGMDWPLMRHFVWRRA